MGFIKRHREWEKQMKLTQLSNAMLKLTKKHAPGKRIDVVVNELCKWALSKAGPPILHKLDPGSELRETVQHMVVRSMEPEEILFLQGEKGAHFWFVAEGQIKIYVEDDESLAHVKVASIRDPSRGPKYINSMIQDPEMENYLGREVMRVGKGQGFGELSLFEGDGLRNASAASGKRSVMVSFPKSVYLKTIASDIEAVRTNRN